VINYDIVVIGGGPAGLAAAIEAKKNGIDSILVVERELELGGILNQCIHSGFGLHIFKEELTGPEYAQRFINELKKLGIEYKVDTMVLDISKDKVVSIVNSQDGYVNIKAKSVILAMGCRERARGAIGICGKRPSGVFTAGTAQKYINIEGYMVGRKIIILGSGDIGLIMARRMTLEGAKVLAVVEKMENPGGLYRNVVQCLKDFDIPLLLKHTVTEVLGKKRVEGVIITEVDEQGDIIQDTEIRYDCDTLLLSVGLIPETELARNAGIDIESKSGGLLVNDLMETSIKGIFACGNVVKVYNLVDYVTEGAIVAGKNAFQYVNRLF
jgi:NADPH-dependent 2,4-dienoyl-CoA reductase/sulfur reductase-like enzyme